MENEVRNSLDKILQPVALELQEFERNLVQSFEQSNALVNDIAQHTLSSGGKRLRPALVFLFAGMVGDITKKHYDLANVVELIHNATLIHDDIIDEADVRRKSVTAHKKWDIKTAVLSGDFLLAKALKSLTDTGCIESLGIFSSAMEEICAGEVEQSLNSDMISLSDYLKRAERKTAMLFAAATQSAVLSHQVEAGNYAMNLGVAFQVVDDLLLFKDGYADKPKDVDFKNNLLTAPVIFALEEGVALDFDGSFEEFSSKIINSKAIDKSYKLALKYASQAKECLVSFEDNAYKSSLSNLVDYVVDRKF